MLDLFEELSRISDESSGDPRVKSQQQEGIERRIQALMEPQGVFEQAKSLVQNGSYDQAQPLILALLQNPDVSQNKAAPLFLLATCQLGLGLPDQCEKTIQAALPSEMPPALRAKTLYLLAHSLLMQGRSEDAAAVLADVERIPGNDSLKKRASDLREGLEGATFYTGKSCGDRGR
ncbi:MAG: tetratricopeptide repeat protein [Planctomycetes bacterium]|nr:tetratricopeptide repeat protein [Planctomycetota bacterium]